MKPLAEVVTNLLADVIDPKLHVTGAAESTELVRLVEPLERQGKYALLGQVHETVGLIDVMIEKARPHLGLDRLLMGIWSFNLATHWYRKAGEHELARITGQRALWELNQFVVDGELRTTRYHEPFRIWYVLEMMGDAAICANPGETIQFYEAARSGFEHMDGTDQIEQGLEVFPGYALTHFANQFLPEIAPYHSDGVRRIDAKLKHWT